MKKRNAGFTLLEVGFVLAVVAIILSVAIPSYAHYQQRQELRMAAETLTRDLRNARELSVSSTTAVFVSYRTGAKWCWGVSQGQPCDCTSASSVPACNVTRGDNKTFPDVRLESAQPLEISAQLGQVALAGAAALRNVNGQNLQVTMNRMGRVSTCGPDANGATPC